MNARFIFKIWSVTISLDLTDKKTLFFYIFFGRAPARFWGHWLCLEIDLKSSSEPFVLGYYAQSSETVVLGPIN